MLQQDVEKENAAVMKKLSAARSKVDAADEDVAEVQEELVRVRERIACKRCSRYDLACTLLLLRTRRWLTSRRPSGR